MKKILLYEPWARKTLHFEFNKCILKILSLVYIKDEIIYCGDKEQIELLKESLNSSKNIKYVELKILDYSNENKIKLLIQELKNINFIKKINVDTYFIINTLPHTLLFLKILFNKNSNIIGCLHGLDILYEKKRGVYSMLPIAFRIKNKMNIKYFVLGESIKKNLLKIFPNLSDKLFSIDHPYTFLTEEETNKLQQNEKKIKIGTIGLASLKKGFLDYIYISNCLKQDKFECYHIGKISNYNPNDLKIKIPSNNKVLSNEEYKKYILELDCILYFYPKNSYKLTASGAIFDALKYNKPLIAIRNDYFQYIFDKVGDIGYLFDTKEDMLSFLNSKEFKRKIFDEAIKYNIRKARIYFSEEVIKNQMHLIIEKEN